MTKNTKNSKRIAAAREMSKKRHNGSPGSPSKNEHKKKNAWWQKFRSYGEFVKGGKKPRREQAAFDNLEANEPAATSVPV